MGAHHHTTIGSHLRAFFYPRHARRINLQSFSG
nr:MAG TPA: hypothetical protein [Caudoviricetes sp.]